MCAVNCTIHKGIWRQVIKIHLSAKTLDTYQCKMFYNRQIKLKSRHL